MNRAKTPYFPPDKMRIVLVGPPGAGKGTHGSRLSRDLGIPHISTGDMFRFIMGLDTPIGLEIKGYMDRHEFVPDEAVLRVVNTRLAISDCVEGYILDGFPRTLAQAQAFDAVDTVLHFHVPDEIAIERALGRPGGRADDTPEVLARRLEDYRTLTEPVLDHYRPLVRRIDSSADIETVYDRVREAL